MASDSKLGGILVGAYKTFKEASLERQVVDLEQELIKLKTPQRYAQKQVKGYTSNIISVNSRIQTSVSGYELRVLNARFRFVGNKPDRTVVGKMFFQLYDSSGQKINPVYSYYSETLPSFYRAGVYPTDNVNEIGFEVSFQHSGASGTTDAFRGEFWAITNDNGILIYDGTFDQ